MTNIEKFSRFLKERKRLASTVDTMTAYTIIIGMFNSLFKEELKPYMVYRPHAIPTNSIVMAESAKDAVAQANKKFGYVRNTKATKVVERGIVLHSGHFNQDI